MTAKKTPKKKEPGKPGRPPKFKTPEELEERIDAYYAHCKKTKEPITITGLANYLDVWRDYITECKKKGDKFADAIKKAHQHCLEYAEGELYRRSGQVAGIIFYLKNNYSDKYRDTIEHTGQNGGPIAIIIDHVSPTKTAH